MLPEQAVDRNFRERRNPELGGMVYELVFERALGWADRYFGKDKLAFSRNLDGQTFAVADWLADLPTDAEGFDRTFKGMDAFEMVDPNKDRVINLLTPEKMPIYSPAGTLVRVEMALKSDAAMTRFSRSVVVTNLENGWMVEVEVISGEDKTQIEAIQLEGLEPNKWPVVSRFEYENGVWKWKSQKLEQLCYRWFWLTRALGEKWGKR